MNNSHVILIYILVRSAGGGLHYTFYVALR